MFGGTKLSGVEFRDGKTLKNIFGVKLDHFDHFLGPSRRPNKRADRRLGLGINKI